MKEWLDLIEVGATGLRYSMVGLAGEERGKSVDSTGVVSIGLIESDAGTSTNRDFKVDSVGKLAGTGLAEEGRDD